jgi:signal transduction histidine kinase/CheY-like chemotaxis protein/HPt (histidine-containing phosphotransfer) domain-containing protein
MDINKYKDFIKYAPFAFAHHKIILNENNMPIDFMYIEVNDYFETITEMKKDQIINKKFSDVLPSIINADFIKPEFQWLEIYKEVALNGGNKDFEFFFEEKNKWFKFQVFSNEKYYFSTIFVDITEEKERIIDLNRIQKIISQISSDFVSVTSDNINSKIISMLEKCGKILNVDSIFLIRFTEDEKYISNNFEWYNEKLNSKEKKLQPFLISEKKFMHEIVKKRDFFWVSDIDLLSEEAYNNKILLKKYNIKSLLCIPILKAEKLLGYFGFENKNSKKDLTQSHINIMQFLSNVLGEAILRDIFEKEITLNKIKAENANKSKTEFLANMSHEIRTPLNSIIGFVDLLNRTNLEETQFQYLKNIDTSAHALLGIINDILELSKLESEDSNLDLIASDIFELTEQSIEIIKHNAYEKGLEVLINIDNNVPQFVVLDQLRVKKILVNLLSNAVKFTESGEVEIIVSFKKTDDAKGILNFSIRDTGIGISLDEKENLFKSFTQLDSSLTRKFGGMGLGLSISNKLAKKMGSSINVQSEKNKGSIFSFSIETEYEKVKTYDEIKEDLSVLIIDNNKKYGNILKNILNSWKVNVLKHTDIFSVLDFFKNKDLKLDLIIVDYDIPWFNGIETIKKIKEVLKEKNEDIDIILLHNSLSDSEIFKDSQEVKIKNTFYKPIKIKELHNLIKNIKNRESNLYKDKTKINLNLKPIILIVEDNSMNMLLMKTLLNEIFSSVDILEAENGLEAVEIVDLMNPDLIFMDLQMPKMGGIEATQRIRLKNKNIPIIALTAAILNEEKKECKKVGMNDFLSKPINIETLIKITKRYLAKENFEHLHENKSHFEKEILFERIGKNKELMNNLLKETSSELLPLIISLEKAIYEEKLKEIISISHSIKGLASNIAFSKLAFIAKKIEESAKKAENQNYIKYFELLKIEMEYIKENILKDFL